MNKQWTRRAFVKTGLCGVAVLALPISCGEAPIDSGFTDDFRTGRDSGVEPGRYFNYREYEAIRALTGVVIPEGDTPGAITAVVVDYIDFLLGAFTVDPPRIFAAGPYSGRHGGENKFDKYLPLSRVKHIGWQTYIEGSKGIPEREFNGPVVGLQEIYSQGVIAFDEIAQSDFGADFAQCDFSDQKSIAKKVGDDFMDIVFEHVVEGMYAAPEYGGNQKMVGWKNIDYEGDRQPVGYSREQMEQPDPLPLLTQSELDEAVKLLQMIFEPLEEIY